MDFMGGDGRDAGGAGVAASKDRHAFECRHARVERYAAFSDAASGLFERYDGAVDGRDGAFVVSHRGRKNGRLTLHTCVLSYRNFVTILPHKSNSYSMLHIVQH